MEGLSTEVREALSEIEEKINANKELSHKDLLTLLASSLLEEEGL